jgi:putative transposase
MSRSKLSNNSRREVGVGSSGIVYDLRQIEGGKKVSEVCREMGVSPEAVYRWKRRYWGLGLNEVRELRQLREENRKLKGIVADLTLDKHILQEVLPKKV